MPTVVDKTIGTGGDYTTPALWFAGSPTNYTLVESSVTGAGSTTSAIQLTAGASAVAGAYVGNTLEIAGEMRLVTAYNTTTKVATVGGLNGSAVAFSAAPDTGVAYTIGSVIWRGLLKNQEFVSSATALTFSGKTVSATCYPELTTEVGASFADHANRLTNALRYTAANGAAIRVTGTSATGILCTMPYVRINKIQIATTAAASNPAILINGSGTNCRVDRVIAESPSGGGVVKLDGGGNLMTNSVIIQNKSDVLAKIAGMINGAQFINCTMVSINATLDIGVFTQYAAGLLKNVYIGNVTAPLDTVSTPTKTNCYSNAAATGFTVVPFSTTTFENITNGTHDFRLKAGSGLIDVGVTDATYGAIDILGTARPQGAAYDVGAHEYTTGGTPVESDLAASYSVHAFASSNLSVTYAIESLSVFVSADLAAAYGVQSFVSSSLPATYSVAGVPASGSFVTEAWINNADTPYGAVAVSYTWMGLGRIGSMAGKTLTEGTSTLSAGGVLTVTGLPAGSGIMFGAVLGANAGADSVFYQAGTVA